MDSLENFGSSARFLVKKNFLHSPVRIAVDSFYRLAVAFELLRICCSKFALRAAAAEAGFRSIEGSISRGLRMTLRLASANSKKFETKDLKFYEGELPILS